MNTNFRNSLLLLLFILADYTLAETGNPQPPEREIVRQVAEKALPALSKAAAANKRSYGFEARDDLAKTQLSEPYEVFALNVAAVKTYQPPIIVSNLLVSAHEWIFPVLCSGSNRVVLIVRRVGNEWKAIYFGNGPLARQLGGLRDRWASKTNARITLVSLTEIRGFWFTVQPETTENLTPLADVKLPSGKIIAVPHNPQEVVPATESVPKLAEGLLTLQHEEGGSSLK